VNEALRAILTPQLPHMSLFISIIGILISILIMGYWGRKRFIKMAVGN
jgi:ABC-2 type transport system permease protein